MIDVNSSRCGNNNNKQQPATKTANNKLHKIKSNSSKTNLRATTTNNQGCLWTVFGRSRMGVWCLMVDFKKGCSVSRPDSSKFRGSDLERHIPKLMCRLAFRRFARSFGGCFCGCNLFCSLYLPAFGWWKMMRCFVRYFVRFVRLAIVDARGVGCSAGVLH